MNIPFFNRIFSKRAEPITMKDLALLFSGGKTKAGVSISEHSALTISAVYAAVRIISETIASLSLHTYKRLERGKERAYNHPLYNILHYIPNQNMDAFIFWETITSHVLLWGNGYAEIIRDSSGKIVELKLLLPSQVSVEISTKDKTKKFRVTENNKSRLLFDSEVLHISGLGFDGLKGYSVISLARESFGLSKATEEFGEAFFGNGTNLGGYIEHPGQLTEQAQERLKKSMISRYAGIENAHKIMVLEEGMKFHKSTMPLEDAQFLETRKFQNSEIARWFRVPPHLLADLDKSSFSNIEQQSLEFLIHTIRPWCRRIESAIYRKLFTDTERKKYFCEFDINSLLRGDIKSRYEAFNVGRNAGFLSVNDIREMENMNPVDGGDTYLQPLNMTLLAHEPDNPAQDTTEDKTDTVDMQEPNDSQDTTDKQDNINLNGG